MSLLKHKKKQKDYNSLRVTIAEIIFEEVISYCKSFQIDKYHELFEQVAANGLSCDKD